MPQTRRAGRRPAAAGLLATLAALSIPAHGRDDAPPAPPAAPLTAQLIRTGLYLIGGGGCNSVLRLSANGYILVDGKLPGGYRALKSQVRKITVTSDLPLRAVVVTDHHANHTGNAAQFMADGVAVIAQQNLKNHLAAEETPAGRPGSFITFDRSHHLRLGGVDVELMHFGRAQTDDGTVAYFPNLKVVAVGDLYTGGPPEPDYAGGGSLIGWGAALAQLLQLDFDVAVPGEGPPVDRAEVAAFKARVDTLVARAKALVSQGVPKEELMSRLKTDDLGWRLSFTGDRLDGFYDDLSSSR